MRTYVLVNTEIGREASVAKAVRHFPNVTGVDVLTGAYDVVVEAEAEHRGNLIHEVEDRIRATPGVIRIVASLAASHEQVWEMGREPAFAAG